MRKGSVCLIVLMIIALNVSFAQQNATRVVIIGLDGLSVEGFNTAKHPNLDKVVAEGILSLTTRPVMPSVTLPNWTSHLTGSGPEEHGVVSNAWTLDTHSLKPLMIDKEGYYPSIFKVLKENISNARTAFYYNWAQLINSMNKNYIDETSFQWKDRYDTLYQKAFEFIVKNRKKPTLVFLYSVHVDHAGHDQGWMSERYIKSIEEVDTAIGDFLQKLKQEDLYDNTHFMLITDHGGIKTGHGGTTMDEMQVPWAITGPKIKRLGLINLFNSNKNTALVIAKIFGIKTKQLPASWTGSVPQQIFK